MTAADKLVTAQLVTGDRILVGSYTEAGAAAADISSAEAYERVTRNGYTVDQPTAHTVEALFVANRKRSNATEVVRTATVQSIEATIDTSGRRARRWYVIHTDMGDVFSAPAQTHYKGQAAPEVAPEPEPVVETPEPVDQADDMNARVVDTSTEPVTVDPSQSRLAQPETTGYTVVYHPADGVDVITRHDSKLYQWICANSSCAAAGNGLGDATEDVEDAISTGVRHWELRHQSIMDLVEDARATARRPRVGPVWVVCSCHVAGPYRDTERAEQLVDAIVKLGHCQEEHRLVVSETRPEIEDDPWAATGSDD